MQSRIQSRTLTLITALCLGLGQPLALAGALGKAAPGIAPPPPGPAVATVGLGNATLAQCAPGFNKSSEQKDGSGRISKFVCMTPIIVCPKNPNYPHAYAQGKVNTNAAGNPEQGVLTLVYSCTYTVLAP